MHKILTLNNGIKVIYEKFDYYRSVAIGFWIKTGSIDEVADDNGVCHFIEHMLFKGTTSRTAKEIANSIDDLGGELNAFTSRDCTCFYGKVVDEHLYLLTDIIADMLMNPLFDEKDIENEKKIILEELSSYEDSPEDICFDMLSERMFQGTPLSANILGTEASIKTMHKRMLEEHMAKFYNPEHMYVSVAGSIDEEKLMDKLNATVGLMAVGTSVQSNNGRYELAFTSGYCYKDIEQVHFEIGLPGLRYNDDRIYPMAALNAILGSGVSSRLFQKIREDKGLVYSISSSPTQFEGAGFFSIYSSVLKENLMEVLKYIGEILDDLLVNSVSAEEFKRAKDQLKGSYILDLEGSESIMNHIGKSVLFDECIKTTDEVLARIETISIGEVNEIIKYMLEEKEFALSLVGKIDEGEFNKAITVLKGSING